MISEYADRCGVIYVYSSVRCCGSFLGGESSLHEWGGRLSRLIHGIRWGAAETAPVWYTTCLVIVVSGHRATAQDVLQRSKYCTYKQRNNHHWVQWTSQNWDWILAALVCDAVPPNQAVQLGLAGGLWIRKLLVARASQYLGFSTSERISARSRCRNPGSMAVPPIITRFSDRTLRVSMGHW